jgi:hypothetical protein
VNKLQSPAVANRVALFGMTALFIALAVPFAIRKNSEWMAVYIRAARDLLAGTDFYAQGFGYLYPPFMALLFAPFTCLPELAMRLIWYVVNVLSIIGLIGLSWRLSGGTLFTRIFHDRHSWIAASLGLACSERYISNALNHQQTDILIACLIMAGCFELTRERGVTAGVLVGIAAACKATPLLFAPYLAWRRQWGAAAALTFVAIGVNLAPNLVHAPPVGGTWLLEWLTRFVVPVHDTNVYPGTWGATIGDNQSLGGLFGRVVTTKWTWSNDRADIVALDPLIGSLAVRILVAFVELLLLAVSFWVIGRSRRIDWHLGDRDESPPRPALESGIILCLMLLISPMSSRAHFVTLVLPAFCLARHVVRHRDWTTSSLLCVAILAGLANRDLMGDDLSTIARWYGVSTIGTIALWLGCISILRQAPPPLEKATAGSAHRALASRID